MKHLKMLEELEKRIIEYENLIRPYHSTAIVSGVRLLVDMAKQAGKMEMLEKFERRMMTDILDGVE